NVRVFSTEGKLLRAFDVTVGYDLPAIRKALKNFLPDEVIGVEMVNTGVALTGQVSSSAVVEKALKITKDFVGGEEAKVKQSGAAGDATPAKDANDSPDILNLLQVTSGQQVMLRVRVGEINRTALKTLGLDLSAISGSSHGLIELGTGTGLAGLVAPL